MVLKICIGHSSGCYCCLFCLTDRKHLVIPGPCQDSYLIILPSERGTYYWAVKCQNGWLTTQVCYRIPLFSHICSLRKSVAYHPVYLLTWLDVLMMLFPLKQTLTLKTFKIFPMTWFLIMILHASRFRS